MRDPSCAKQTLVATAISLKLAQQGRSQSSARQNAGMASHAQVIYPDKLISDSVVVSGEFMDVLRLNLNFPFRLLLTFNATSLLVIIFLVQKGFTLSFFFPNCLVLKTIPNSLSYVLYLLVPILLTGISLLLSEFLGKDEFKKGQVETIEHANNSFLPSYLGYFFVALSIGNWETLVFVYGVLFIFTFRSQALYFNPLFLLYGYEFYNITTASRASIFLISREKYKIPNDVVISNARRINNYTFIDRG